MSEIRTSVDAIRPFLEQFGDAPDIQVMGGLGSAALRHPKLVIDSENKELRVPDHKVSLLRPNGTKRDADVFVATTDTERIKEVKRALTASVAGRLAVSVCAFHPHTSFDRQPYVQTDVTSDRYCIDPFRRRYGKVLSPFVAPIDPEGLEQWHLIVNDELSIPVSHPGATLTNYTQRSIVGLRPKDKEKTDEAARMVFAKNPEIKEWLLDGPGRSQFDLSHAFTSMRQQNAPVVEVVEGIELPTISLDEMIDGPLMIAPDARRSLREQAVKFAALKSRAAFAIESNKHIVKLFNDERIERLFKAFVKNR